jgi:hypothetical protein
MLYLSSEHQAAHPFVTVRSDFISIAGYIIRKRVVKLLQER